MTLQIAEDYRARRAGRVVERRPGGKSAQFSNRLCAFVLLGVLVSTVCQMSVSAETVAAAAPGTAPAFAPAVSEKRSPLTFVSGLCSNAVFVNGSSYHYNVGDVLLKLTYKRWKRAVPYNFEMWEEASDPYDNSKTAYGVSSCTNVTVTACTECLGSILNNLQTWCPPFSMTAEIVLENCYLHYSNWYIKLPSP